MSHDYPPARTFLQLAVLAVVAFLNLGTSAHPPDAPAADVLPLYRESRLVLVDAFRGRRNLGTIEDASFALESEDEFELNDRTYRWRQPEPRRLVLERIERRRVGFGGVDETITMLHDLQLQTVRNKVHLVWTRQDWEPEEHAPGFPLVHVVEGESDDQQHMVLLGVHEDDLFTPESIVFVLDASGSMGFETLRLAKDAIISSVNERTHSETECALIVHFDCDDIRLLVPFTTESREMFEGLEPIVARGGTPLGEALRQGFEYLHANSSLDPEQRRLVSMTDGLSSCGAAPSDVVSSWDATLAEAQSFAMVGINLDEESSAILERLVQLGGGTFADTDSRDLSDTVGYLIQPTPSPRSESDASETEDR